MNTRRIDIIASIAQAVSAVAVVVTLLYVATEVRHSDALSESEANALLYQRVFDLEQMLIGSDEFASLTIKAEEKDGELSRTERRRYLSYQHLFFDTWEMSWDYYQAGFLSKEVWKSWDNWFASRAKAAPSFAWTENRSNYTSSSFRSHVDDIVSTSE